MMAIVLAPPIPASIRRRAGMTMTRMPPAMLEPIERWLPVGAVDDVAVTRNLPGGTVCRGATAVPSWWPK